MPIPETGPVSLLDISTEFPGNANPLSLSEYYAGGLYVSAGTTGNLGLIPSAGLITFDHFRGSSNTGSVHILSPVEYTVGNTGFLADSSGVITDGNLVPQLLKGQLLRQIAHISGVPSYIIAIIGINTPQNFWTEMVVGSQTLLSADATYIPVGTLNDTQWTFFDNIPVQPPWVPGVDIPVTFTYPP